MKTTPRITSTLTLALSLGFLANIQSVEAAGVAVGSSALIGQLDYSDTFTGTDDGGLADRPYIAAVQGPSAYIVESTYGNPAISFDIGSGFSFASDLQPTAPGFVAGVNPYPTGVTNASGAGSSTGFTQTGGAVDYGLAYALRDEYIVQVDAVTTPDRIDISSGATLGIFGTSSLSVFFRGDGTGNASLFNGATDTGIQATMPGFNTGIVGAGEWHNFAARYDIPDQEIELYVDEASVGLIDLTTFAGGIYGGFSNDIVGAGGAGGDRVWTDNFQVGAIPEPSSAILFAASLAGLLFVRRRGA